MEHAFYAQGQPIKFNYRVSGDPGTAVPVADVMDATGTVVATLTPGSGLTQSAPAGTESIFEGVFTPTSQGAWKINCRDAHGGNYVKTMPVGLHGMQWLIAKIIEMDGQLDAIELSTNQITVIDGKLDDALSGIAANLVALGVVDGKSDQILLDIAAVKAQMGTIETKVDGITGGGAHIG